MKIEIKQNQNKTKPPIPHTKIISKANENVMKFKSSVAENRHSLQYISVLLNVVKHTSCKYDVSLFKYGGKEKRLGCF